MEPTIPQQKPVSNKPLFIGLTLLIAAVVIVIIALVIVLANKPVNQTKSTNTINQVNTNQNNQTENQTPQETETNPIMWNNDGRSWTTMGTVPACEFPLEFNSPVDLTQATNILYPGQTRGGDFKPHGGFRFDNNPNNNIEVKLPLDAQIFQGSRYIESGELQIILDFIAPCGIMFRFDHIKEVSAELQEFIDTLPEAKADDTRTTIFQNQKMFKAGTIIATKVGFSNPKNVSVDFGVYDLRATNNAVNDQAFVSMHSNKSSMAFYGLCWLNNLTAQDKAIAYSLPGSGTEGKTSDYCK